MPNKSLKLLSAIALAVAPAAATAQDLASIVQDRLKQDGITQGQGQTGGQSYGDQNRGGSRGFYAYPRHRHVDGSSSLTGRRTVSALDAGTSPYCRNCHGSAYYGRDYGAPYFDGGYYDRGGYYRERRER